MTKMSTVHKLAWRWMMVVFMIVDHHHHHHSANAFEWRSSSRTIKTKYGTLRGMQVNLPNKNLRPIEAYLGVAYASPPVGKLRFMPPVTPAIWSGVRNANAFGPVCPQKLPIDIRNETLALQRITAGRLHVLQRMVNMLKNQSEDCLYLNIYTPLGETHETTRVPVVVVIHGESYEWNAGSTLDGSVLASYAHTVVITINFRLGILGFFPSLGGRARGNFGLMDQVAALHWIQENVREFGGDERNVTIVGHGHGAACVNFLMLSPMARGLFHRAIMQSGSALSPWALASDAIVYGRNVAKVLGCDSGNSNHILECLRRKTVSEIVSIDLNVPTHLTAFGPVIDGIVIPAEPQSLMAKANTIFANYDLIFGVSKAESYNLFSSIDERHGIDINRRHRLLRTLVRNLFSYHLQEILLTILNEYTDWTRPFFHPISLFESLVDIFSDALVVAPITQTGLLHAKSSKARTFFYTFAHQTENGDYNPRLGCVHGQDLAYLLGAPLVNGHTLAWFSHNYTRSEVSLSESLMKYVAHFAHSGNPNNETEANNRFEALTRWPVYDDTQQQFISFATKTNVQDHYQAHRLSYWFNLLPQLHKPGNSVSEEHHLLEAHENILTYDGVVRSGSISAPISFNTYFGSELNENDVTSNTADDKKTTQHSEGSHRDSTKHNTTITNNEQDNSQSALDSVSGKDAKNGNASFSMIVQSGNYSTALSLTIAIGCSLLILNMLVFAGIFYQKDKNRLETKLLRKKQQNKSKEIANVLNQNNGPSNVKLSLTNADYCSTVPMFSIDSMTDNLAQVNNQ